MVNAGLLNPSQFNNTSCLRMHGLLAKVKNEAGNYLLTSKGSKFLNGEEVPRLAIIRKSTKQTDKHNIGYYLEDEVRCTAKSLLKEDDYWEGINFRIEEGRIIREEELTQKSLL